ncbi:E3 ubiquitin-protein ligase parkin, partial [Octopus sinensis]
EFDFYCLKHPTKNSVLLKHIFNNSQHYSCITCEGDLNPILIYPCEKSHVMCLDCFKIYCEQYLLERKFRLTDLCYSIRCPDHCEQSFIQEAHHFRILGDIKYEEYQNQATRAYLQNTYSVYCPNPHCKECFEADLNVTDITCLSCKHKFCRQCSHESHDGPCGREAVEGSDLYPDNQLAQQSAMLIHKISKKCPKCEINVEKSGGCNHMICKCEAEWCWVCGKTWSTECLGEHWFD